MPKQEATPTIKPLVEGGPVYPHIEQFIETASAADIDGLFTSIRDGLKAVKGPRADQAKKVDKAIQRAEELLSHLLEVRESIEKGRGKSAGSKK